MTFIFHEIFYRPLFNLLIGLYNHLPRHDLGLAIILLTILIRFVFVPLSIKAQISQRRIAQLQPKLQELQTKHKEDKKKIAEESMALYKEHKVNPLSGCLPILIQLPVIWALYRVFIAGFKEGSLTELYHFVHNPGVIKTLSFGFLDLAHNQPVMAVMAGVLQFLQAYNAMKMQSVAGASDNPALKMSRQMVYFFPIMIVFISWKLPAGLVLYWIVTTAFSLFEQMYIKRHYQ